VCEELHFEVFFMRTDSRLRPSKTIGPVWTTVKTDRQTSETYRSHCEHREMRTRQGAVELRPSDQSTSLPCANTFTAEFCPFDGRKTDFTLAFPRFRFAQMRVRYSDGTTYDGSMSTRTSPFADG
jgi:hypothetical protein